MKKTIAQRYELLSPLGKGGMGVVYLANDHVTRTQVAIKLLHPDLASSKNRKRLIRELEIAKGWQHPRIVRYLDSGFTQDGSPFFVMEVLQGRSMKEALRSGPFSIADAQKILQQIAEALVMAHGRGVVHRDLKPDNIFLSLEDDISVKILDFGIAKQLDADVSKITSAGSISGTVGYLAPESVFEERDTFARDIYALGLIVIEAMTGQRVFRGANPTETMAMQVSVPARIPAAIWEQDLGILLQRCVSKRAHERPTAAELVDELRSVIPIPGYIESSQIPTPADFDTTDTMRKVANGAGVELLREAESARKFPEEYQPSNTGFYLKTAALFLAPLTVVAFMVLPDSETGSNEVVVESNLSEEAAINSAMDLVKNEKSFDRKLGNAFGGSERGAFKTEDLYPGAAQKIRNENHDSSGPQRMYNAAFKKFTGGDYEDAITICRRAIELHKYRKCHGLIGSSHLKSGRREEACKHYELAEMKVEACE